MSQIIAVASGKGGAGKSSVCTFLGRELALLGRRTLIVELDSGLRGLDLALGVSQRVVYDLGDILQGRCGIMQAPVPCEADLWLICAPVARDFQPEPDALAALLRQLAEGYDVILLDTPAGLGAGVQAALAAADLALLVVTPDAVCVRDGRAAAMLAEDCGAGGIRLIINMVPEKWPKETCYRDLDRVIDETAVQLIGVLPAQAQLAQALAAGVPLPHGSRIQRAFCNIANRICGKEVELLFS